MIEIVGVLQRNDVGHPEYVYGSHCKDVEHALMINDIEILLACRIEPGEKFGRTVCDGLLIIENTRCNLEADCSGNETKSQWEAKLAKYPVSPSDKVLVVATSEERMRRLMAWSKGRAYMMFAWLDGLKAGRPWARAD